MCFFSTATSYETHIFNCKLLKLPGNIDFVQFFEDAIAPNGQFETFLTVAKLDLGFLHNNTETFLVSVKYLILSSFSAESLRFDKGKTGDRTFCIYAYNKSETVLWTIAKILSSKVYRPNHQANLRNFFFQNLTISSRSL